MFPVPLDRALQEDPGCAPAWSERGSLMRELHQFEEVASCFEKALALGGDPELNGYYLAAVRDGDTPTAPPRRYVEELFDDYAADFQSHLVEKLGYRGFEVLLQPLLDTGKRYRHVLDLGCGTGLCGPLVAPQADAVDGVDVSSAMLEQARKLGVYRELIHADLGEFLAATALRPDLILAADVFIYAGDLAGIFRSVRRILEPGGCLAFTVEPAGEGLDLQLLPSLRYAHSEAYIRRLAGEARFTSVRIFEAPTRHDQTTPRSQRPKLGRDALDAVAAVDPHAGEPEHVGGPGEPVGRRRRADESSRLHRRDHPVVESS